MKKMKSSSSSTDLPLTFSLLFIMIGLAVSQNNTRGSHSSKLNILNNCSYTVWPGVVSTRTAQISPTGFILEPGKSTSVSVPASWSGRIWGRTLCTNGSSGNFSCLTGDCGSSTEQCSSRGATPPVTLAQLTFDSYGGSDFYYVSLAIGYNLPILISPHGGAGGYCSMAGCAADLNNECPSELEVVNGSEVVACKSPCVAFGTPQYCCTESREKCKPTTYSRFFENACPAAYSYAMDDNATSLYSCVDADYDITFCPSLSTSPDLPPSPTFADDKCRVSNDCHRSFLQSSPSPSPTYWDYDYGYGYSEGSGSGTDLTPVLIGSAVASIVLVFAICCCVRRCKRKSSSNHLNQGKMKDNAKGKKKDNARIEEFVTNFGSFAPNRYSYGEIKKITKKFKVKLGQGGFGSVYQGKLLDGRLVAVKVLSETNGNGEDFVNEVGSISRTSHVNIVTLLGFCFQKSKRALVYEFMPQGSLDKFIYSEGSDNRCRQLEWKTLFDIALGIARGLEYLHQGCNTRILHFDIKPHNILLDEDFCPKIADFGLSKLCERKESVISMTGARGTFGYIAPEVFSRTLGGVSHKSDVYSYGMMVLEMVGGRRNINVEVSRTSEIYYPTWIYKHLDQPTNLNDLNEEITEEDEIKKKLIAVSLCCIQINPLDRPSISKVIEMLQGSLQSLVLPPRPP